MRVEIDDEDGVNGEQELTRVRDAGGDHAVETGDGAVRVAKMMGNVISFLFSK